jgi:parallel beta-helix repeat protein
MFRIVLLVLTTVAGAPAAAAVAPQCTVYVRAGYVPPAGIADGRTPATAFATITAAAQHIRNAGTVVCIGPGLYREANIGPTRSGAPSFPIVFRGDESGVSTGDPPGAVVLMPPVPAPGDGTLTAGFRILGQRAIEIDGLEIEGFGDAAIQVRSGTFGTPAGDITIRNCDLRLNQKAGVDISGGGRVVLEHNRVVGNGSVGVSIQHCGNLTPSDLRCRGALADPLDVVVSNNRIGINAAHGVLVHDATHALLQNNIVFSNQMTGMTLRASPGAVVLNNLIYSNEESALQIGPVGLPSPDAVVANNTLYDNGSWGIEIGSPNAASPGALVVYNVIAGNQDHKTIGVLNENGIDRRSTCGYVAGFNVVDSESGYGPHTPWNVYDIRRPPQFAAAIEGPDGVLGGYHLVTGELVDGSGDDLFRLQQDTDMPPSPGVDIAPILADDYGLTGTTAIDSHPDVGPLDAGFHADALSTQVVKVTVPFMPIFVRRDGADTNNGKSPAAALATIAAAAKRARAGVSVIVGPGTYPECDLHPDADTGKSAFVADFGGTHTGDAPGPVLVDAGCCRRLAGACVAGSTGFNIPNVCGLEIDGFTVRGALDGAAIQIQDGSHDAEVRNTITFSSRRGIQVINADDVRIINNLAYANEGGIQLGGVCRSGRSCADAGSHDAVVEHNTCYANTFNGLLIGAGAGSSTGATVRYNILHVGTGAERPPGETAFQIGSNTTYQQHLDGFSSAFNLVGGGRYGAGTPRAASDRVDDPLFVAPSGYDGVLGGEGFEDDSFQLQQLDAGNPGQSPAVDFSDLDAAKSAVAGRTTRTDGAPDIDLVDLGFHYPVGAQRRARPGDCNGDGRVTIDELIRAVAIALGTADVSSCPALDWNGDGRVSIDEVVRAVRSAVAGR